MKKWLKIILLLIAIFIIIINIPFYEKPYIEVEDSVLIQYHRLIGIVGDIDIIKIYKNGSVEADIATISISRDINLKLSNEQIEPLKDFIDNKEYKLFKESLYKKYMDGRFIADYGWTSYFIKVNDKTIRIRGNEIPYDIIREIDQKIYRE